MRHRSCRGSRQSRACGGVVWGVVRGRATGVKEACDRRDLYGEPLSARALQIINPLPPDVFSPFLFERLTMLLLPKPAKSWPKTSGRGRDRKPKQFFFTPLGTPRLTTPRATPSKGVEEA